MTYEEKVKENLKQWEEMCKGKTVHKLHIEAIDDKMIVTVEGHMDKLSRAVTQAMVNDEKIREAIITGVAAFTFTDQGRGL